MIHPTSVLRQKPQTVCHTFIKTALSPFHGSRRLKIPLWSYFRTWATAPCYGSSWPVHTSLIASLRNQSIILTFVTVSWPKSKTEQVWTVDQIGNHSLASSTFYFFLQKSDDSYCTACNLTSSHFAVKPKLSDSIPTIAHTTSPTHTSTSTSSPTSHPTSTHSPPPTASSKVVGNSVRPKTLGTLSVELGVGLGAGIPAVLAVLAVFFLWLRHRRDKRQKDDEDKILPTEAQGPRSGKEPMRERDSHLSRESGALGPYAQHPSPTWEQQEAREQAEPQQQYHERHRRGSSARHIPFRPSLGAHSEVSDESSQHSWIDDFDFERPGYQDVDEMSQANRSIRAAPSWGRSHHSHSAHSQSSILDVADIPPVPQPVHLEYYDRNWPPR